MSLSDAPPLANAFDSLADFSSKGPTRDGRLKPDLLAPGTLQSARSDGANTCSLQCALTPCMFLSQQHREFAAFNMLATGSARAPRPASVTQFQGFLHEPCGTSKVQHVNIPMPFKALAAC